MAVQMFCIQMCGNHRLKTFAPDLLNKLYADFLSLLRGDLSFVKTQISMPGENAAFLLIHFLDGDKI